MREYPTLYLNTNFNEGTASLLLFYISQ